VKIPPPEALKFLSRHDFLASGGGIFTMKKPKSRSLERVTAALAAAGLDCVIEEMAEGTRTAADAAAAAGCALDQIVKSIIFRGEVSGHLLLFMTAGGNRVSVAKAAAVAGQPLGRADPDLVRAETGFAIGGVSPIGHLAPVAGFFDPRLLDFTRVWAAAGTPRHIFAVGPGELLQVTGARLADFTQPDTEGPAPRGGM